MHYTSAPVMVPSHTENVVDASQSPDVALVLAMPTEKLPYCGVALDLFRARHLRILVSFGA